MCSYTFQRITCPACGQLSESSISDTCPSFSTYRNIFKCPNFKSEQFPSSDECEKCRLRTQTAEHFGDNDEQFPLPEGKQQLPKVVLISTGGTITGKGSSPTDTTDYKAGALNIEEVIKPVKSFWEPFVNVVTIPLFELDSINLDLPRKITLYHTIMKYLCCPDVSGVVVTIGTHEMSATAQFLDVTIRGHRVVLTGATKPHTTFNADGPGNILASVLTAVSAKWSGVVILMDQMVMRPFRTLKKGNCFERGPETPLAEIKNFKPVFNHVPCSVPPKHIDISGLSSEDPLPAVEIIPVYAGCNSNQFKSAVERGVKGIILEAYSDGYWPDNSRTEITEWAERDELVVVMTSRQCPTRVGRARVGGVLPGGDWNTDQLLNILQLLIMLGRGKEEIKEFILNPFNVTKT
ncbi:hypothetical protein F66182_6762 [Fusarium sp. NRRL 66182]|nr:hypothetical protein F66182_6762 [Fusarium sp. NRRL 66182]